MEHDIPPKEYAQFEEEVRDYLQRINNSERSKYNTVHDVIYPHGRRDICVVRQSLSGGEARNHDTVFVVQKENGRLSAKEFFNDSATGLGIFPQSIELEEDENGISATVEVLMPETVEGQLGKNLVPYSKTYRLDFFS